MNMKINIFIFILFLSFISAYSQDEQGSSRGEVLDTLFDILATIENYTTLDFIGTMTLERKPYSDIVEAVDNFQMESKFYNSLGDDLKKDITKFEIEYINISAHDIDLGIFPENVIVKYGYIKEINDPEIMWLVESEEITSWDLQRGTYVMFRNTNNFSTFNEKLYADMKITKDEIKDTTNGIDIELDRLYFVCRIIATSNKTWDSVESFDVECRMKVKLENDVKFGG